MRWPVVLAGIAISPGGARADHHIEPNSLFVAGGPVLGAAKHDGDNALLVGGELSGGWLHMRRSDDRETPFWLGAYADVLYDSAETSRASFGPEVGYFMVGLDAAVVRELGGAGRWGFAGRASLSVPVTWKDRDKHPRLSTVTTVSLYTRSVIWRDDSPGHTEIGVLVKWVLPALAGGGWSTP